MQYMVTPKKSKSKVVMTETGSVVTVMVISVSDHKAYYDEKYKTLSKYISEQKCGVDGTKISSTQCNICNNAYIAAKKELQELMK